MYMNDSVKSAIRVLEMLELFSLVSEPLGVSKVARSMDIPKSSAQGLLNTLVTAGYLVRTGSDYLLAPGLEGGVGWVGGPVARLSHLAAPVLRNAADISGESAFLCNMAKDFSLRYVAKAVSRNEVRYDAALTHPRAAYSTSAGLAILAHQPINDLAVFFKKTKLMAITPKTITDEAELRRLCAKIKRDGHAEMRDAHVEGASGISAPVFNREGFAIAAFTLVAPTWRYAKARSAMIMQAKLGAAELTRAMTPGRLLIELSAA